MNIRTLLAATIAVAALAAPGAASAASCPWGPQIGTACIRDPQDLTLDTACPVLEGQTVFGIKCAPHQT